MVGVELSMFVLVPGRVVWGKLPIFLAVFGVLVADSVIGINDDDGEKGVYEGEVEVEGLDGEVAEELGPEVHLPEEQAAGIGSGEVVLVGLVEDGGLL